MRRGIWMLLCLPLNEKPEKKYNKMNLLKI